MLARCEDVWLLPSRGLAWCTCGRHQLDRTAVLDAALDAGLREHHAVSHGQLLALVQRLWGHDASCRFLQLRVQDSARFVAGCPARQYAFEQALAVAGYFSKTWQGCPDPDCR